MGRKKGSINQPPPELSLEERLNILAELLIETIENELEAAHVAEG